MPIRVCHVTSMHKPFDGRIFRKQCISLSKKYEVCLIQANTPDQVRDGIRVFGVSIPSERMRKMLTRRPVLEKALEVNADIYHIHDPELLSLIPRLKKKIVE